jgi:hypothetical protein
MIGLPLSVVTAAVMTLLIALPVPAQETSVPYVTSLQVSIDGETVRLAWEKAESEPDHYVIIRSPSPINSDTYPEKTARLSTVSPDTTSYTDTPPDDSPYYYAVLSARKDGSVHSLFIPHRNVTAEPIALQDAGGGDSSARVTSITAEVREDRVVIRLRTDRPNRPILLYRSTAPILSEDDILQASLIATIGEGKTTYTDVPLAGVSYYYAAIDARLAEAGAYRFAEGKNSLAEGVELPISRASGGTPSAFAADRSSGRSSSVPLPFLQVNRSIISGERLSLPSTAERKESELDETTSRAVNSLMASLAPVQPPELEPTVLPEDRDEPGDNDEQVLKNIVDGPFSESDWEDAEKRLGQLLSTRIGEAVKRRAHFYLAQSYYFQRDYTAAFFEFVLLEDSMYDTVRPWLYRVLELRDASESRDPAS